MRIVASVLILALVGLAAPAASACRIAPTPIPVTVWERAPTADQLRPGEVALEVAIPTDAHLTEPTEPDQVIVVGCNPDQRTLFQVVRVLSGDAHGAEFVVVPGWITLAVIPIDPATGAEPAWQPAPEHWFVVGRLNAQSKYIVSDNDAAARAAGRALPALDTRLPPQ